MQKYKNSEVKPFTFSELRGTHVVHHDSLTDFEFKELTGEIFSTEKVTPDIIRQELTLEKKHNFKIEDQVRQMRGLADQENADFENRVEAEVQRRIEQIYQQAYQEGFAKGQEEGHAEIAHLQQTTVDQTSHDLVALMETLKSQTDQLLLQNKNQSYEFIKKFAKWVVLKEIDTTNYLQQLLEKLILEMNVRKNIVLRVSQAQFPIMNDVIKHVEERVGQLSNVRVEILPEIQHPGIILECDNGLIDGSLEGVFKNIDKIFEQVIVNE